MGEWYPVWLDWQNGTAYSKFDRSGQNCAAVSWLIGEKWGAGEIFRKVLNVARVLLFVCE